MYKHNASRGYPLLALWWDEIRRESCWCATQYNTHSSSPDIHMCRQQCAPHYHWGNIHRIFRIAYNNDPDSLHQKGDMQNALMEALKARIDKLHR